MFVWGEQSAVRTVRVGACSSVSKVVPPHNARGLVR